MPASLFFVEIIFFQHVSIQKQIKNYLPSLVATGILLVLLGIAVFLRSALLISFSRVIHQDLLPSQSDY